MGTELSPSSELTGDKNVCLYAVRGSRHDAARRAGGDLLVVVLCATILVGRGDTSLARLLILARQAEPRLAAAAAGVQEWTSVRRAA